MCVTTRHTLPGVRLAIKQSLALGHQRAGVFGFVVGVERCHHLVNRKQPLQRERGGHAAGGDRSDRTDGVARPAAGGAGCAPASRRRAWRLRLGRPLAVFVPQRQPFGGERKISAARCPGCRRPAGWNGVLIKIGEELKGPVRQNFAQGHARRPSADDA